MPNTADFNDADNQVQDDPRRHDYNLDEWLDKFIAAAVNLQNNTRTNHQMWPCGSDFNYQNADHWFHNLDKFIHYVNLNASRASMDRLIAWAAKIDTTAVFTLLQPPT